MNRSEKQAGFQSTRMDIGNESDPFDSAKSNSADRRDMARMGKAQEMNRNFRSWTMFSFSVVLMASWEVILR